ncbi:GNAT family N-acetyltransferase [Eggerthella sp. YY7918]|uniref:GNAT family N-acetyltransferase n=1 Tax=Eggerthella sp. (strain YY7918) TaxID=502558 RepID=UPI0002171920|nr:GNAT family N-acetyltransferase [Eggerthella sp. YY7918]BAK44094.1 acetyltransferase [Eggerthella sp. YY7918]
MPNEEKKIKIRSIKEGDLRRTFTWVSQPWYLEEFAGRKKPTWESHMAFFTALESDHTQLYFAVEYDKVHIGNAGLKYITDNSCECWYYIGDINYRGMGLSSRIVELLSEYAYKELKIDSIKARILETNLPSIGAVKANGFTEVAEPCSPFKGQKMLLFEKRYSKTQN